MVGVRYSPYTQASNDRKERKPMVEKLRRERMNNSISQLKELISTTIGRYAPPMSRIDKADILEYAVVHLQQLQQQQTISGSSNSRVSQLYEAGFKDCARETVTFLNNKHPIDDNTVNDVNNHMYAVYRTRKESGTGSQVTTTDGPCLSTPVRIHSISDNSRLQTSENGRLVADCSPIKSCVLATSPQDVTSFKHPEVAASSLGDLSLNTAVNILNAPDTSSSDVSMDSKETSSLNTDSFCSRRLSNLFDSLDKFPLEMSIGSSGCFESSAPLGDVKDGAMEITMVNKCANFEAVWRPW